MEPCTHALKRKYLSLVVSVCAVLLTFWQEWETRKVGRSAKGLAGSGSLVENGLTKGPT